MPTRKSLTHAGAGRKGDQHAGRSVAWVVMAILLGGAAALISTHLPMPLVLPALSVLFVVTGFAIAAALWLAGVPLGGVRDGRWEIAGALVLVGFAAAILTDGEQALALLEQMTSQG
ncbi:MAG TPA: hypothetical protein VE665_07325 [Hyphomicrobiaceae bacterium]|nr:hypothetical protein [Hyphomicrobiaceae bacterium]